jgi:E3 ubiquitin-protein ligase HUWE1
VEELLCHVQSLRSTGVGIIIEIVNKLSSPGGDKITEAASTEEKTDV